MNKYSQETDLTITKTLDKHIGLVVSLSSNGDEADFFRCNGKWVSFAQCLDCIFYSHCSTAAQVNMVGSEDYKDALFTETKEV